MVMKPLIARLHTILHYNLYMMFFEMSYLISYSLKATALIGFVLYPCIKIGILAGRTFSRYTNIYSHKM